jgi:hypothetical protein
MRKKQFFLFLVGFLLLGISTVNAQLFKEQFNYVVGDTIGAHGWVTHNGANPPISIVNGSLSYLNYPTSVGNSAYMGVGNDYSKQFTTTAISADSLYFSMLVNIDTAKTTADYFFHSYRTGGSSIFLNRIYVKKALNGNVAFGILKGSTIGNVVWSDSVYSIGTTYLLVLKLKINPGLINDIPSLFINPTISATEPLPNITASDITSADYADIDRLALRQGGATSAPKLRIDEIRVANSWSDAVIDPVVNIVDVSLSAVSAPISSSCGSISDTVKVTVNHISGANATNIPIKALITNPDNTTQLLSTTLSSLAATNSALVSLAPANTTMPGVYHVKAWTALSGDPDLLNDTVLNYSFTTASILPTPFIDDFQTIMPYWQLSNMSIVAANAHGNFSATLSCSIDGTTPQASGAIAQRISPITSRSHLLFNYRIIDQVTNIGNTLQAGDSILVEVSTNCQSSFTKIASINALNHQISSNYQRFIIPLTSVIGQTPIFRITAKRTVGNYIIDIDSLEIRNADLNDMAVVNKVAPISKSCGVLNDPIKATFKNNGDAPVHHIPVSVMISRPYTPPFITFYDTITSTILPGEQLVFTFDSTLNTTVSGKYTMLIKANLATDTSLTIGHTANNTFVDSVFTFTPLPVPYLQSFTNATYLNDYTSTFDYNLAGGFVYKDMNTGFVSSSLTMNKKVGTINNTHFLMFDYKFTDQTGNALAMGSEDSLTVLISTDCGTTYMPIYTVKNANHTASNQNISKQLPLTAYNGQYVMVSLLMKSTTNNSRIEISKIEIDGTPTISITADTIYKCVGQTANVTPIGSATYDYEWIEKSNPTIVISTLQTLPITTTGYYKVKATNGSGFSAYDSVYVFFRTLPVVNLSLSTITSSLCPNGINVTLNGNTPTGGAFTGIGVTTNQFNPQTAGVGNHIITYTYTDNFNCSNSDTDTITVTPITAVTLTSLPDFCLNDAAYTLTQGTPASGVYSGSGVTLGVFTPSASTVGAHVVTYTFTDTYNCAFRATDTLMVKQLPNAYAGADASICAGDSTTLVATGGGTYMWSTGSAISSTRVSPANQTSYFVTVTGTNNCIDKDTVVVTVKPIPTVQLAPLDTVCLQTAAFQLVGGSATPTGGVGVYSGPGVSNNFFNPVVGLGPHVIRYTYTLNGCSAYAEKPIFVENCVGIIENVQNMSLTIMPNPVENSVTITADNIKELSYLLIYDVTGKMVFTQNVTPINSKISISINLQHLQSGVYFVKLRSGNGISMMKLVKN